MPDNFDESILGIEGFGTNWISFRRPNADLNGQNLEWEPTFWRILIAIYIAK
jgi:hypothetical protein